LIRSALIKHSQDLNVYISLQKSMTIQFFIHSRSKRAESIALVDSGATENFMSLEYAKYLHLPIRRLLITRKLFNVDGTPNKSGELQYFTDLQVCTGSQHTRLRFFLTNLGENKCYGPGPRRVQRGIVTPVKAALFQVKFDGLHDSV